MLGPLLAKYCFMMVPADNVRQPAVEKPEMAKAEALEEEARQNPDRLESVNRAHFEIDTRCFGKISGLNRYFDYFEAQVSRLRNHLGVKYEIIRVQQERNGSQQLPAVGPKAAVAVSQIRTEDHVFGNRECAIGQVFPEWHAALKRPPVEDPATHHHVGPAGENRLDKLGNELRIVLVVGVKHDDHLGALLEGFDVAGFLVPAVAPVLDVNDN